jgi:hypothetical protein
MFLLPMIANTAFRIAEMRNHGDTYVDPKKLSLKYLTKHLELIIFRTN